MGGSSQSWTETCLSFFVRIDVSASKKWIFFFTRVAVQLVFSRESDGSYIRLVSQRAVTIGSNTLGGAAWVHLR